MDNIASRIISLRGKLSRRPFAKKIGTTESTLRNYEKGVSLPDAQILKN
ncbi:helix-turn-helix domain-containing protein, partial [Mailhella sp.]